MTTIEFFHDVICSFCFPMSYRMRQIEKEYPDVKIIHRSFALAWEAQDFERMFGSRKDAKAEILHHWHGANQNDDLHRFNIEGMKKADFLFPTSMNGLLAAKAADIVAGTEGYWSVFDGLQHALFVENQNIEDLTVIEHVIEQSDLNLTQWQEAFKDPETKNKVLADFQLSQKYQLSGVPALVINGKYLVSGAQSLESIKQTIMLAKEKEAPILEELVADPKNGACNMEDGRWKCTD